MACASPKALALHGIYNVHRVYIVRVRDLPERDIWSLRVGRGVGGKSMFLPPSSSSPPLAWTRVYGDAQALAYTP